MKNLQASTRWSSSFSSSSLISYKSLPCWFFLSFLYSTRVSFSKTFSSWSNYNCKTLSSFLLESFFFSFSSRYIIAENRYCKISNSEFSFTIYLKSMSRLRENYLIVQMLFEKYLLNRVLVVLIIESDFSVYVKRIRVLITSFITFFLLWLFLAFCFAHKTPF